MRDPERRKNWMRGSYRRRMIKFFYGITLDQFDEQMTRQNGACAFCGFKSPAGKFLSVDHAHGQHDHAGSKRGCPECVRGLLCFNCNRSVLPVLEKNPHLQNDFVKQYLVSRPFLLPVGAIGSILGSEPSDLRSSRRQATSQVRASS